MIQFLLAVGVITYLGVVFLWDNVMFVPIVGMVLLVVNAMLVLQLQWNRKAALASGGSGQQSLNLTNIREWIKLPEVYKAFIVCIFVLAIIMRLDTLHINRDLVQGSDEQVYHYAAENLLKYGTLTLDRAGDMFKGTQNVEPTGALSPGYPLYIAAVYALFHHSSKAVFISQFLLSLLSFWLIHKILSLLQVGKPYIIVALFCALLYPGFYYNIDRMLTETLFTALFMGFVYLFLKGMQKDNLYYIGVSAALLGYDTHVRALAFPFIVVAMFFLIVYERKNVKRMMMKVGVLAGVVLLCMIPWWIRNWATFHMFMIFSEAGESPQIWGAVPYFLDIGSAGNKSLAAVLHENVPPNPAVFYKWRIFGFFQYMWGDIWDERLVHSTFRPFIFIQQLIIVPCVIAIPFLIRKCRKEVVFISCIPISYTLMNMPFHGLPRYVYPSISFVFILLGVLLERIFHRTKQTDDPLWKWQGSADLWMRRVYFIFTILLSLNLFYSVYVFAYGINKEESHYRLSRYMGVSIDSLHQPISSHTYNASQMEIANATKLHDTTYKNTVDAPVIVTVKDKPTTGNIVTEVTINTQGGYLFDLMTVYWKGKKAPGMSENYFYKFPTNIFQHSHKIYIDDDVNYLTIVPHVFRGGSFTYDSIVLTKYLVDDRQD